MEPLGVKVSNGGDFDRVYTYVVYLKMKSLYRLNTEDNISFYAGNNTARSMLMPKYEQAVIIGVGYKGTIPALCIREFLPNTDNQFKMTLNNTTPDNLRDSLKQFDNAYLDENSIYTDLRFMQRFYEEEQRQKALMKEREFIWSLWKVAYPCCLYEDEADTTKAISLQ
jgi:hypothetical protein